MEHHAQVSSQQMYMPAIVISLSTRRHSLQKLPVATLGTPGEVCGSAQRVGYTGSGEDDLAIYRLKIKAGKNLSTITLPGFFVIENGIFQSYEQWCRDRESETERTGR